MQEVRQCYNCYSYGHVKFQCSSEKRCVTYGENFRGKCEKKFTCINYKSKHRSNFKGCDKYIGCKEINVLVAENNISPTEAKKILKSGRGTNRGEDIWSGNWPTVEESYNNGRENRIDREITMKKHEEIKRY